MNVWAIPASGSEALTVVDKLKGLALKTEKDEEKDTRNILVFRMTYNPSSKELMKSSSDAIIVSQQQQQQVTVVQIFILMWPLICYLGMVSILLVFLLGYRGSGNSILGIASTSSAMHNHTAVMLISMYAALGWVMSNGIVFNPLVIKKNF